MWNLFVASLLLLLLCYCARNESLLTRTKKGLDMHFVFFFVVISLLHATNISRSRIARFGTVYFTVHYLHCLHLCSPLIHTVAVIPLRLRTRELAPLSQSHLHSLTTRK